MTGGGLISLAVLGPGTSRPLPFACNQMWLLDPHDPLEVLFPRLARWISETPEAWILAQGGAAAVLLALSAARLDLRIAGAALIAPRPWDGRRDQLSLPDAPVAFPLLLVDGGRLPSALTSTWSAETAADPFTAPEAFLAALARRSALQASTAAKARRLLASSTEEMASRTSSIVARTAQVDSSGQSVQGK